MGFGKSEQIYKEATKQKLIHVEDEQTKQSQKQGQSQPEQMQQKKTDLLENVMQKYQENASQVDLSEVKKDQSADMEEQIVVTTSIHETKNAELILEGEQLSQNKQEQIHKAEQEMKETESSRLKEKEEEEEQDLSPKLEDIHITLQNIKASFDADTDSSSQTFTFVKTTLNSLLEAMENKDTEGHTLSDALLVCRNAAVHYYNTHRGHRWSDKGKRRKDLINQLVDATHEAMVNQELPEIVRDRTISAMLLDTTDTGYESKKSKEFFCAQAKKESGRANADEYSYQIRYTNRLMEKWHEIDANRPLELVAEKILKYEIKPEVLTPEYIKRHYAELMRIMVSAERLLEAGSLYGDMSFFHEQLEKRILFFRALFKQCDRVAQHAGVDGEQYQSEEQRIALIKTKTKLHISTSSLIANAFDIRNAGRILGYDNAQPDRIKGMSKSATLKYFGIENLTLEQKNALDERLKTNFTDTERNEDWLSGYEEDNSDISIVSYNSEGDKA